MPAFHAHRTTYHGKQRQARHQPAEKQKPSSESHQPDVVTAATRACRHRDLWTAATWNGIRVDFCRYSEHRLRRSCVFDWYQ